MNDLIGKQFNQYQIGPLLGEGGMGIVYRARDLQTDQVVALKIMLANLVNKPAFRQRFTREAQAIAGFNCPAIIKIYDSGDVDGIPYMAMEYIPGGSLAAYLKQVAWAGGQMPLEQTLALGAQIAEGLAYAHQRGLIHRDVKPGNVLLKLRDETSGPPRQAVLTDFGLAIRLTEEDEQATNPFMGSLAYMSPEQCENKPVDGRADIYAAGILLYQLATGQLPYQINAPADIMKHLQETPLPPRLVNPHLPPVVEEIILKAMAKRPSERYQTAAEMAHALRQASADDAVTAVAAPETENAVTQWLDSKWVAGLNVADRVDVHKTWTSDSLYRLFVVSQYEGSQIYSLNKPEITIGRSPDNDIVLEDRTISAHHVRLRQTDAGWQVRDLGSTNGLYLGDRALEFEQDVNWPEQESLQVGPYYLKWQTFSGNGRTTPPLLAAPVNGAAGKQEKNGRAATAVAATAAAAAVAAAGAEAPAAPPLPPAETYVAEGEILALAVTPDAAVVEPGVDLPVEIVITNRDVTVKEVSLRLLDENDRPVGWAQLLQNNVKLLPEESAAVSALVSLPFDSSLPAGDHFLQIQAVTDKGERETARIRLTRAADESFTLDMHPLSLQEGVVCRLTIRDNSNFANEYTLAGLDDADKLLFDFQEPQNAVLADFAANEQRIRLNPGAEASVGFTIRPRRRPWFGSGESFPFKMRVRTAVTDWQTLHGQVEIRPRISRRMIILLLLLLLLLALLGFVFFNVVSARNAEQQRQILAQVEMMGGTATAVYQAADAAQKEALDAQATADALSAAGQDSAAQSAQATANALKADAAQAQSAAADLENQLNLLESQLSATATPPPPPTDITLDAQSVPESASIGSVVGQFSAAAPSAARPAAPGAAGGKPGGVLARPARQPQITFTLVSGDGDADNGAFYVDGAALKTAVLFDYETKNSYSIRVQADNGFGGTFQKSFVITITDVDDTPVITISDVTVNEDDGTAVVQVTMSGSTQSEVAVTYETKDGTAVAGQDYSKADGKLTWKPGENGRQEIRISLQDDDVQEEVETLTVSLSKPVIAQIETAEATVTINDDDPTPSLTVTNVTAGEGDGQVAFTVTLAGKSSRDISVSYATADGTAVAGEDYTAASGTLTWTAGETGGKEVSVILADDDVDEPDESFTLTLVNPVNARIESGTAIATLTDNDSMPRISLQPAGPFVESAGSAVITVLLEGSSSSAVSVSFATEDDTAQAGEDYTAVSGTLSWPAGDSSARQITVAILSDAFYESGEEAFIIRLSNPVNGEIATETAAYAITDDDTQPALSIGDVTVNEAAGEVTVVVQLNGGSRGPVTVDYATADGTAVAGQDYVQTASPPSLTWTANEQNSQKTFTIPITDDAIDEGASETFQVMLLNNSNNVLLADNAATVTIIDDDTRGVTVGQVVGNVNEPDETAAFRISLTSEPTADVTIPLAIAPLPAQCRVPASVTLTPVNWSDGVSVTIEPINDAIDDDDQNCDISLDSIQSSDTQYNGFDPPDVVQVVVGDDDTAGVVITPTMGINVTEGGPNGAYQIYLTSEPVAEVTISFELDPQLQQPQSGIIFTPGNWNTPQTVNVVALDDPDIEDLYTAAITHTVNSSDPNYSLPANPGFFSNGDIVSVQITDNDSAGLVITPTVGLNVTENGATDSYTIALASRPTDTVTVTLATGGQITPSVSSLFFGYDTWDTPQTVIVTAVDDAVDELSPHTGAITHTVASNDLNYAASVTTTLSVDITDNDTAGIVITPTTGISVTEGGATDSYTVALNSQPTDTVTINLAADNQLVVAPAPLVFTAANWNIAQNVVVTANDDAIDEPTPHTSVITHTAASNDPNYAALAPALLSVSIADNDTAGVVITPTTGISVTEDGATDTYTIVLDSQPTEDVTISFDTGSQIQPISNITFTVSSWNVAQTIIVTAQDDPDIEGNHTGTIIHTVSSADPAYNPAPFTNGNIVSVQIADNDTAGVNITESDNSTNVTEGGATDTYTVALNSRPTASVTVTLTTDGQTTTSSSSLFFNDTNWNIPQTIVVTAVDDDVDESSPHTGVITHTAASNDPNYAALAPALLSVSIADNDTAGIVITPTTGISVTEGGATDSYTIVLESQPTEDVTISFDTGSQIQPISNITFTVSSWNIAQTITVIAQDDSDIEGNHTGTIIHTVSSADPAYNPAPFTNGNIVSVQIADNDP